MNTSGIRGFFVGVIVVTPSLSVLAMTIPKIFVANQPIKASDVNLNFSAVKTAVDTLELKALRFGTVATGVNTVAGLSLINTGTGNGLVSTASGTAFGIAGVAGYNLGTTNFTVGVYGVAKASPSGTGVKGIGGVVGGYFEAVGNGVPGLAPTGVLAVSTKGQGVIGRSATSNGVYGVSSSALLRVPGVLGVNNNATGQVVGILGQATISPIGTGVNGIGKIAGGFFEATGGPSGGFYPVGIAGVASLILRNGGIGVHGTGAIGVQATGNEAGVRAEGGYGVDATGTLYGVVARGVEAGVSAIGTKFGVVARSDGDIFIGYSRLATQSAVFRVSNDGTVFSKGVVLTSDRNAKTNFSSVNALNVLEKVVHLPIQRWNYKDDASSLQHVGPMAQDFHAAFGLNGSDDKHISTVDVQGVALAAIQGLNQKLETENADLRAKLANLETRMLALERK
jgi:Chaperone of endosialidase